MSPRIFRIAPFCKVHYFYCRFLQQHLCYKTCLQTQMLQIGRYSVNTYFSFRSMSVLWTKQNRNYNHNLAVEGKGRLLRGQLECNKCWICLLYQICAKTRYWAYMQISINILIWKPIVIASWKYICQWLCTCM